MDSCHDSISKDLVSKQGHIHRLGQEPMFSEGHNAIYRKNTHERPLHGFEPAGHHLIIGNSFHLEAKASQVGGFLSCSLGGTMRAPQM